MAHQWYAFRSAILCPYVVTMLIAIMVEVSGRLLRDGLAVDWSAISLRRLLLVSLTIFVLILAAAAVFRVYVSVEGLRCYTFMGNYHTLRWPEMKSVRPFNLLGLRYLRVTSTTGYTVWVPLFLADMSGFRAAVQEFAGEGHSLSKSLG